MPPVRGRRDEPTLARTGLAGYQNARAVPVFGPPGGGRQSREFLIAPYEIRGLRPRHAHSVPLSRPVDGALPLAPSRRRHELPVLWRCPMPFANRPDRRTGVVIAVGLLVAGVGVAAAPPGQGVRPSRPVAHVWVTTPDGSERMHDRGTVAFTKGGSHRLTITV